MSGDKTPVLCWDSCIFLAWFNREKDKPLDDIAFLLKQIAEEKTKLLVSAVTFAEVLDKAGKSDAGRQFREFMRRPNVTVGNADERVGRLAADIRIAAIAACERKELEQSVKIPDALIAASAVIYGASHLLTFDPVLRAISKWEAVKKLPMLPPDEYLVSPLGY